MNKIVISLSFFIFSVALNAQQPLPSPQQLKWSGMEFYLFVHFGPNTFTDLEWGKGTEPEDVFNPTQLDCRQWCRIAKAAGAKGIIITAKHHDGFCLWPSKYSAHTVAQSKWKEGHGDVLRELSVACKEYGLKMGVYLSPWDRNHPKYGTPEYNDVFVNMMKEVVNNYGPFFEFWWDGANGEGPNGKKQVYDWHRFEQTMRSVAPNTVVFSDIGPDIRWVGNENGIAGDPNWNYLDTAGFTRGDGAPPREALNHGSIDGKNWIPAECDVSIRPGWFYHQEEDEKVKTPEELFQLYLKSVGRGANLLLNVPPDRRGLINEHDSAALMEFKKLRDESFAKNILQEGAITYNAKDTLDFKSILIDNNDSTFIHLPNGKALGIKAWFTSTQKINCIELQEPVYLGQKINGFVIAVEKKGKIINEIHGTTVGRKRIITFPTTEVDGFYVAFHQNTPVLLSEVSAYLIEGRLIEKQDK